MVRIMPLGDSLTWGVVDNTTDNEESGGYRTVLYDLLLRNGFPNDPNTGFDFVGVRDDNAPATQGRSGPNSIDNDHEGYRGENIQQIRDRIADPNDPLDPTQADVVLLMLGTNDRNSPDFTQADGAPARLDALIGDLVNLGTQVLVASIPPFLNAGGPASAAAFNAFIPGIVEQRRTLGQPVTFVDVAAELTPGDVSADNLHIELTGFTQVANAWYNALLPILDPNLAPNVGAPREPAVDPMRLEVEQATLDNFQTENPDVPETTVIRLPNPNNTPQTGTATLQFTPPTPGRYDLVLSYFDENDGEGEIRVSVNGQEIDAFTLTQQLGSDLAETQNFVRRTVGTGIFLDGPAEIQITATSELIFDGNGAFAGGEFMRIDNLELVAINDSPILPPTAAPVLAPLPANPDPATNQGDLVSTLVTDSGITDLDNNAAFGIAVTGVDNANGTWEYSLDNGTSWIPLNPAAGNALLLPANDLSRVRFLPNLNYGGDSTLAFRAWDRTRGTAGQTVPVNAFGGGTTFSAGEATATVTVEANTPPVAEADTAVTNQNVAVNVPVLANDTDADGDPLALSILTNATGGTAVVNDNGTPNVLTDDFIVYTPNPNFTGTDQFTYQVDDGQGGTSQATVSVTVNAVNTPPVAEADTAVTNQNVAVNVPVLANDTDADGNPLTLSIAANAANGTAIVNDNGTPNDPTDDVITYTPNPNFTGTDQFTYQVDDGQGGTSQATVSVTVNPVDPANNPPVASDDTATTEANTVANINVLDNDTDPDGDLLALSLVVAPSNGIAQINDNNTPDDLSDDFIAYTPNPDFTGTDQFTYQVSDGRGGLATATVGVTVTPIDDTTPPPPTGTASLVRDANNFFTIAGDAGQAQLLFTPVGREADFANEVGVFLVAADGSVNGIAPGSPDYTQAALSQGQVIFSSVPDAASSTRQLSFNTGDRLMFYLVSDGTTDEVLAGQESDVFFAAPVLNSDGFNYLEVSDLANSTFTLRWEDDEGGGDEDFNDFEFNVQLSNLPAPIGAQLQGGQQQELVDLRDQTDPVQASFSVSSEAAYDNFVGFYAIADVDGSIDVNQDGLVDFRPGDAGYAQAAIQQRVVGFGSDGIAPVQLNNLLLAPFIIADGTPEEFLAENPTNQGDDTLLAYFAFLGANPDGRDHVRLLGDNRFGFEDQFGGGDSDFNDITFQVEFA